jgi:hypothetical protein
MIERRRRRSQSTVVSSAPPPWRRLFGEPIFLQGEDPAAYGELLARIRSAVKPPDMIQEMLVADVVWLEWDVLRWRRLKGSLIRARGAKALEDFVYEQLDENDESYELYWEQFANCLAGILQHNLPEDQVKDARRLAHKYAENEQEAVGKVDEILARHRLDIDDILRHARRLSALAVFWLSTSSIFAACSTGRSAGLTPPTKNSPSGDADPMIRIGEAVAVAH